MRLIYCTSIAFSNKLANRVQVQSMAREFQKKFGENFFLGVNYKNVDDESIKIVCFNSAKSYILAWRYLKFIREKSINYVYCREARLLFFIILFNKLFFRSKLNFTYEVHALLERNAPDKIIDKFLSLNINKFIFVTKNLEEKYLNKYKVSKNKSMVAADGVSLEIFDLTLSKEEARKELGLPIGKKILIYTGKFKTMGMDKGISDILKALKLLSNVNILFIAVGGSNNEIDYYRNMSKELSIEVQVKLVGLSPQTDLAVYQKAGDVLLMPFPYTKHYAFFMSPLKMFEYMASKRPIIATDLPSIKEVLNNSNAIIVKFDNPEGLARGIKAALEDKNLVERITKHAFQNVGQYTWERRVKNILEFMKCA